MPKRKWLTEEEVRLRVERDLGRSLPDGVWQLVVDDEYVKGYLDGSGDFSYDDILQRCRKLLRALSLDAEGGKNKHLARSRENKTDIPPDKRLAVLGEIWAAEARREPEVIRFREEVLGGRLLTWEEAAAWIERQAQEQGTATLWVKVPLPEGYRPDTPRGLAWLSAFSDLRDAAKETWPVTWSTDVLAYLGKDEWVRKVPVARAGVLGRLKALAAQLTKRFPLWSEAQAVMFVLTDSAPILPEARIKAPLFLWGNTPLRITLEVDGRMSPEEVARLYSSHRNRILREVGAPLKDKPLSEKSLCLAVYLAKHFETPWVRLMKSWNAEYPAWAYSDLRTFARDAKAAWCRLTGREWTARHARKERTQNAEEES